MMQLIGVRALVLLYLVFFTALAGQVVCDAFFTSRWEGVASSAVSVLIGIAALSGWFTKTIGLLNFLFGFAGGVFAKPTEQEPGPMVWLRLGLLVLTGILILLSLIALWLVADASRAVALTISAFHTGKEPAQFKVADVIDTLGTLNLTIAAGFLIGLACPGAVGTALTKA